MRLVRMLAVVAAVTAATATVATPRPARADDDAAVARDAYGKGMAHYHLEEYDAAISEWERGFRAKPAPEFLYNIAQAYRLSKRPDKALSFYQKYLRMSPQAPNRDEVERHMAAQQKLIDEQKRAAATAPPPATTTAPSATTPAPAEPTAPASASTSPATSTSTRADLVAQPAEKPVYKKGWFWGVLGGVAAVAVAGVVVGVVYGTRTNVQTLQDARVP